MDITESDPRWLAVRFCAEYDPAKIHQYYRDHKETIDALSEADKESLREVIREHLVFLNTEPSYAEVVDRLFDRVNALDIAILSSRDDPRFTTRPYIPREDGREDSKAQVTLIEYFGLKVYDRYRLPQEQTAEDIKQGVILYLDPVRYRDAMVRKRQQLYGRKFTTSS